MVVLKDRFSLQSVRYKYDINIVFSWLQVCPQACRKLCLKVCVVCCIHCVTGCYDCCPANKIIIIISIYIVWYTFVNSKLNK